MPDSSPSRPPGEALEAWRERVAREERLTVELDRAVTTLREVREVAMSESQVAHEMRQKMTDATHEVALGFRQVAFNDMVGHLDAALDGLGRPASSPGENEGEPVRVECTTENWEKAPDHRGRIGFTNPVRGGHLVHVDVDVTAVDGRRIELHRVDLSKIEDLARWAAEEVPAPRPAPAEEDEGRYECSNCLGIDPASCPVCDPVEVKGRPCTVHRDPLPTCDRCKAHGTAPLAAPVEVEEPTANAFRQVIGEAADLLANPPGDGESLAEWMRDAADWCTRSVMFQPLARPVPAPVEGATVPVCDPGECIRCQEERPMAIPMGDDGAFGWCATCAISELSERNEREAAPVEKTTGEVVERVARAIYEARVDAGVARAPWADLAPDSVLRARYHACARAALAASSAPAQSSGDGLAKLLDRAADMLGKVGRTVIATKGTLATPYTDAPDKSPYSVYWNRIGEDSWALRAEIRKAQKAAEETREGERAEGEVIADGLEAGEISPPGQRRRADCRIPAESESGDPS